MKRLFLIIFFFVISFSSVFAQQNLDKSILWEIKGKNSNSSSYLLGTFHMVCETDLYVSDKVLTAINEVEQIALEVNLSDIDELRSMQELMISPTRLSSQLSLEEKEEFRDLLKNKYAIDLETVDHFPPIILMGLFAAKEVACEVKAYDMEIMNIGLNRNKKFLGLEHFKDQIELTNRIYSARDILSQLREKDEAEDNFETMVTAFNQEDIEALYTMAIDSKSLSKEMKVLLLDNRNRSWVKKMTELMVEERTLFAVGAGHLAGENGVIALLRAHGFTVTAVLN